MGRTVKKLILLLLFSCLRAVAQDLGSWMDPNVIENLPGPDGGYLEKAGYKFGASAIWTASPEFLISAHAVCDQGDAGKTASCFTEQMVKANPPGDAFTFTRLLYGRTGEFAVMGAIKDYPPVAVAWVVFPLRASNSDALLIVNGKPPFIDLDDMKLLDKTALQKDPLFLEWKATAPQLDVFPAERSAGAPLVEYQRVWPGPKPGDIQFVISYPLINGCATCAHIGFVNYLWTFDSTGNFLGTKLLSVTRGVPPLRRNSHTAPPTEAPAVPAK